MVRQTSATLTPRAALPAHVEDMLAGLRTAGLRLTPQRVAVVRELALDESHPTAQELFDRLRRDMPTMSFATVYNTLDTLQRAGMCLSLSLAPGSGRFDPNVSPHDHLVCDGCGAVRDVPSATRASVREPAPAGREPAPVGLAPLPRLAKVAPGFQLRAVEQVFRGLCESCSRARSQSVTNKHVIRKSATTKRARDARV